MYHGWGRDRNYFEGWYFKVVDPAERYAFAFIPGISHGSERESHSFIQVLDGKKPQAYYHQFQAGDFQPAPDRFAVRLGGNFFSGERLQLDLPGLQGELLFRDLYPWPKMLGAPGIMGWYSFVPFMECYHGVVSVNHRIEGDLKVDGKKIDFSGGKGYTEKDWGQSFPSSWIWMQTNHFDEERHVSLSASVARIPWVGSHFIGYIVGFLLGERLYRFATYTGAQMQIALNTEEKTVHLVFRDQRYTLEITAYHGTVGALVSPISGNMTGKVNESMNAVVDVVLYDGRTVIFQGRGRNAGLEVAGPVEELLEGN